MNAIEEFLKRYRREYDFFDHAGRVAAKMLDDRLRATGLRAIVTSRPKAFDGLKAKVEARAPRKNFVTADDIFDDIVDLAGVRIALYFPGDQVQIDRIVRGLFVLHGDPRTFPDPSSTPAYEKRFSGYHATHYRIQLKEDGLADEEKHCAHARIELQVASVLMHAWAEVEHDLVYKPRQGTLSAMEYAILDELNGMVLAGETDLMSLQKAGETRVGTSGRHFGNHYDLATHLLSASSAVVGTAVGQGALGSVDILFEFIKGLGLNTPNDLGPYVASLRPEFDKHPLADQIIDRLLSQDSNRYALYERVRTLVRAETSDDSYQYVKEFLDEWVTFEKRITAQAETLGVQGIYASRTLLTRIGITNDQSLQDFDSIRAVRNEVVHGFALPPVKRLIEAKGLIDKLTKDFKLS